MQSMVRYFALPSALASSWSTLTFPVFSPLLEKSGHERIAIAAASDLQPIGLALGKIHSENLGEVLSLYVAPEFRNKGIGRTLFVHLEEELRKRGAKELFLTYMSESASVETLEKIFSRCGWRYGMGRMLFAKYDMTQLNLPKWAYWNYPTGFASDSFDKITPKEKILLQQKLLEYPPILNPFTEEDKIEPLNSLALRHYGQLVGWIVTHRTFPDQIRYTSLFVPKELQKVGLGIRLIGESVRKHYALRDNIPLAIHGTPYSLPDMVHFTLRRLFPHTTQLYESFEARKA